MRNLEQWLERKVNWWSIGETGLLFATAQVEALTEALLTLLQNRELAEQTERSGREIATAQSSEDACVDKFLNLSQTNTSTQIRL